MTHEEAVKAHRACNNSTSFGELMAICSAFGLKLSLDEGIITLSNGSVICRDGKGIFNTKDCYSDSMVKAAIWLLLDAYIREVVKIERDI